MDREPSARPVEAKVTPRATEAGTSGLPSSASADGPPIAKLPPGPPAPPGATGIDRTVVVKVACRPASQVVKLVSKKLNAENYKFPVGGASLRLAA